MSETTKADVAMRARRAQDHISYIRDALLIGSVEPSTTTLVDHLSMVRANNDAVDTFAAHDREVDDALVFGDVDDGDVGVGRHSPSRRSTIRVAAYPRC